MKNRKIIVWILPVLLFAGILIWAFLGRDHVQAKTIGELQQERTNQIETMLEEYQRQVDDTLARMEREMVHTDALSEYEKSETFQNTSENLRLQILEIRSQITLLKETSLGEADFVWYQQEMTRQLRLLQEKYNRLEEEDRTELKGQLALLHRDLEAFRTEYEDASKTVQNSINHVEQEIGTRKGTIYEESKLSIWQTLDEMEEWLKEQDADDGALRQELENLRRQTETLFEQLNIGLEEIELQVAAKMDASAFYAYKDSLDQSMITLQNAVAEVEEGLEEESGTRMQEDENLQAQLDDLQDRWNQFCNVSDVSLDDIDIALGSLRQVIGNQDVSQIGDGTISGSITYLYKEMGECRIHYDATRGHFYAEYSGDGEWISRQLDYVGET